VKKQSVCLICLALFFAVEARTSRAQANRQASVVAWNGHGLRFDVPGVIGRSDIVLGRPNLDRAEAMPLGNGKLGVAVWSADGLTAQLNRNDAMPDRLSAGEVVIPGLAPLTRAHDYGGRLDLYHGEFREQGGGMTATAFVEPDTEALIVIVTGAIRTNGRRPSCDYGRHERRRLSLLAGWAGWRSHGSMTRTRSLRAGLSDRLGL